MNRRHFWGVLALIVNLAVPAVEPIPDGGEEWIPRGGLLPPGSFYPGMLNDQPVARAGNVLAAQLDFSQALRVEVLRPGAKFYNGSLVFSSPQPVRKGNVQLVQLRFRSVSSEHETGESRATVFVQGPGPHYQKYLVREISAGTEWKTFQMPLRIRDALDAGKLSLHIGAGGTDHLNTWEIGDIRWVHFGDRTALEDLPITRGTYGGRDKDAAWRDAAASRISKHRQADFQITVVDTQGTPVPDAFVDVKFRRHAFHFGSVIVAGHLLGESEDSVQYRRKVLELFNQSGTENDLKWGPWEGDWGDWFNRKQTLEALRWLKNHQFYTRGHVMVWPARKHLSKRVQVLIPEENPAAADPVVKQIVLDHITDIARETGDLLDEWDVVNEPFNNHDLMDAFGEGVMVDWFQAARRVLPEQGLFLNDFGIISGGGRDHAHQLHFENTLRFLLDRGAPVTGMGMQGHFSGSPTPIEEVYKIIDRFHRAFPELEIRITEFDIDTLDRELQADYTRDLLTIVFSHPATVGVQCWGFWEGAHWRPEAAMYSRDWHEKPNGRAWRRLTREIWWSDFAGHTDAFGHFFGRGFYGEYKVQVRSGGLEKTVSLRLQKNARNKLRVVLERE